MSELNQELIAEYERFPMPSTSEFDDSAPMLTQSWSDISHDCEELGLREELENTEDDLIEELDVKFNVDNEILISKKRPDQKSSKFKYQNFEAITARLNYEDLEILRALKSNIKVTRQQYVKPDGVKRERITENMILRSLVKCFAQHSLDSQTFNWAMVNTEEDLFKQISRAFKGIGKEGLYPDQV